jgi:hypothetical protein
MNSNSSSVAWPLKTSDGGTFPFDPKNGRSEEGALESHFSVKEIAKTWGLSENSVRDLFKDEPGVVRIQRPKSRYKRSYTTLRIPRSVIERVHRRMSVIA